jgi:TnpA family transposase
MLSTSPPASWKLAWRTSSASTLASPCRATGAGRAAIADGTHVKLRENNLIGSRHIRYGGYGGIAYHHIADTYVALFTSFIPCGVWEAVHILDALMKNRSVVQPDTIHADTQGQSESVFGLCRMLGIKLMPRIRGLGDAVFYRPCKTVRYRHIDALFRAEVDWELIAAHAHDMLQVVISIQAGRVMPSMLLRRLGTASRLSRLYRAFRELGRVERTLFLLRFISSAEVRRTIRAETTKIEAYNDFPDWVTFGGPVVKSGDPVEQEKQLKYASLVANSVMLSNVADLTRVLSDMAQDGHPVTPELVACTSPYMRRHILRFGKYTLDRHGQPAGSARTAAAALRGDRAIQAELVTTFSRIPNLPQDRPPSGGSSPGSGSRSGTRARIALRSPSLAPSARRRKNPAAVSSGSGPGGPDGWGGVVSIMWAYSPVVHGPAPPRPP